MAVPKKRTSKAKKNARKANWKKKADKQAQRALLVEKGIIQDNAEMPQTKEAMMLNSGGLANLFRVKTQ